MVTVVVVVMRMTVIMTMKIDNIVKYVTVGCELTIVCVISCNISCKIKNFISLPIINWLLANSRAHTANPPQECSWAAVRDKMKGPEMIGEHSSSAVIPD